MIVSVAGTVRFRFFALLCTLVTGLLCMGKEPAFAIFAEDHASRHFCELLLADRSGEYLFLEREEINRILQERKLQGGDLANRNTLARLTRADLFIIVESGLTQQTKKRYPSRLVIFNQINGFRLLNRSLPEKSDEALKVAGNALEEAVRAVKAPEKRRTLAFLAARNDDVRPEFSRELKHLVARLELELHHLPDTTVMEREFLNRRLDEERLTGPEAPLPPSSTLIRLEFTPVYGEKPGYTTTLRLTDTADKILFTRTFEGKERNDTQAIVRAIGEFLKLPPPEKLPDVKEEARRCYNEFFYLKRYGDPRAAMRRVYAAIALDPGNVLYQTWALDTMRFELSKDASVQMQFALVHEALALMERGVDTYYFKHFASYTILCLLDNLDFEKLPPELQEAARRLVSEYRPKLIPYLTEAKPKDPPTNEKELIVYAQSANFRCAPSLYFDRRLQLSMLEPTLDLLQNYAAQYPHTDLCLLTGLPEPDEPNERACYQRLADRLVRSPNLFQEAQGRAMLSRLQYKVISTPEERRIPNLQYAKWVVEQPEKYRKKLREIGRFISQRDEIQQLIEELEDTRRPADDPLAAANASPERLFELLKKQNVDALTMHTPGWAVPLSRQFWLLDPPELAKWNPDYVIRPIHTGWRSREDSFSYASPSSDSPCPPETPVPWYKDKLIAVASDADGGKDGCLLRFSGDTRVHTLEHWDGTRQRLRKIRTFMRKELHLTEYRRKTYGGAALYCDRDVILIGTDDQIIVINRHSEAMTVHSDFVSGRVHSLLRHKGRIYAFLGAGEYFGAEFTRLISFRPDGRDVRTHISTLRDGTESPLEKVAKPYYVWGVAANGENLFFPAITNGYGMSAFWKFNLKTAAPEKLLNLAEGRWPIMNCILNKNFFHQSGSIVDFCINGSVRRGDRQMPPLVLFFRLNTATGKIEVMGWGNAEGAKPFNLKQYWGEHLNFSGPFLVENGNFWCAGGTDRYGMMTHLRLDAPEKSPRLIFPKVRALLPGRTPNSVIAVHDLWMAEIRWRK